MHFRTFILINFISIKNGFDPSRLKLKKVDPGRLITLRMSDKQTGAFE